MRNFKEIGRAMAVTGLLTGPFSGCGTRFAEVPLEDLSKDTCAFEGQTISTSGYAGGVTEALIAEEIYSKPGSCSGIIASSRSLSQEIKSGECKEKIKRIENTTKTNFSLQPKPETQIYSTNATHVYTISGKGKDQYRAAREKYEDIYKTKIKVSGTIIKQNGECVLYADEIEKMDN